MEQKDFGNHYELKNTVNFFRKHWKLLTIVGVVALGASIGASFLITPRYKSSAILFPTSSNRQSKAILATRYSLDFMDYGIERDCEYAIQILSSQSMQEDVCNRFNMMEHYGISANDPQKYFKLNEAYRSNITVKRTEFLGVEISVLDVDPQWAADIANYMAANYDTLSNRIQMDRATDAYNTMKAVCDELENDIRSLEDSLRDNRNSLWLSQLIEDKCQELAEIQTRMSETKVDMEQTMSYKFWLDQAKPADKKAYPKRAIVVLLGTLGTLAVLILTLLLIDRAKREEE
ncbi:MAG: hypothetical protein K5864_08100 [Bacteroidales bacterium]|nr:hypothetical protein [Bacteroidales bacterium]